MNWTYGLQAIEIGRIKGASDAIGEGVKTLQFEGNTERVETLVDKVVNRGGAGPGVVSAEDTLQEPV